MATFKDFIVECEMYPYSKQNFEIMKECEELGILSKMLENHYTLAELGEFDLSHFEYTYTTESTDQIQLIEESVKSKFADIMDKLKSMLTKILDIISGFIKKRSERVKTNIQARRIAAELKQQPELMSSIFDNGGQATFGQKVKLLFNRKPKQRDGKKKVSVFTSLKALIAADKVLNASAEVEVGGSIFTEGFDPSDVINTLNEYQKFQDGIYSYDIPSEVDCPLSLVDFVDSLHVVITGIVPFIRKGMKTTGIDIEKANKFEDGIDAYLLDKGNKTYQYFYYSEKTSQEMKSKIDAAKAELEKLNNEADALKETNPTSAAYFAKITNILCTKVRTYSSLVMSLDSKGSTDVSAANKVLETIFKRLSADGKVDTKIKAK